MVHRTSEASDTLERGSRSPDRSEPPAPALLPGWRSIPHAIVRARGEEGYIELVALHPQKGVALLAFLEKDEVADPGEARAVFEEMLRDMELAERFPGLLPVVALAVGEPTDDLDGTLLIAPSRREIDDVRRAEDAIEAPNSAPSDRPKIETPRVVEWGISLGFAVAIVLALLIVLAFFSRTGRLF